MKNTLFCLAVAAISFTSCTKDSPATSQEEISAGTMNTIRYEFKSDRAAKYNFDYSVNDKVYSETVSTLNWAKTITVAKVIKDDNVAKLAAYPHASWTAPMEANATVKIYINGVEQGKNSGIIAGADRPTGLSVTARF